MSVPATALAQVIEGPVSVVDGDSLHMGDTRIRLLGIDAVEGRQTCRRGAEDWACGQEAADFLAQVVKDKVVRCEQRDRDAYGRTVATCFAGSTDLSRAMVEAGYAVALPQFSDAYVESESRVRDLKVGIWGTEFALPSAWRSANRIKERVPRPPSERLAAPPARSGYIYFRNCAEAWAAGAAPITIGQPGYRPQMDGDSDGIACEPFRRRYRR